jgi:hypothetical protein
MLLARSVGSIGMALPAFLVPDWDRRQAEQRGAGDAERANRPSHSKARQGLGPAGDHRPGGQETEQERA